jgi:hypothetical protein
MARKLSKHNEQCNEILKLYNQEIIESNWSVILINTRTQGTVATVWLQTIVDKIIEYHELVE